jgi:hypothetical protein
MESTPVYYMLARKHALDPQRFASVQTGCPGGAQRRPLHAAPTSSNMKTFMIPDAPYTSAPRTCRTHKRMFIACFLSVSTCAPAGRSLLVASANRCS